MIWIYKVAVLIGWREFEQNGVRQSFEYSGDNESDASYTVFHPKVYKNNLLEAS